jgi:hypothetical protein
MTEALSHPHDHANPLHFSEAEWAQLQADDRHGGAAVIGLMTVIFSIGLILYTIVLISILS